MPATTRPVCKAVAGFGLIALSAVLLAGCNTIAGAGQDLSSAGHDVTGGATATQQSIHRSTGAATN
jgi:predicted small secreted protein